MKPSWFHPLANEHIKEIADIQLIKLRERLTEMGYLLEISDAALDKIASSGFDPVYGARPLKRAIQQTIENPLAQQLLSGDYSPGDVVVIDANDEGLLFLSVSHFLSKPPFGGLFFSYTLKV
ncbi:hypothetical protein ACOBV8_13830 [Pseudoalteromonas espejiana]